MAQSFEIKRLAPQDVQPMRQLLETFARAFEDPATYLGKQPTDAYLSKLLGNPNFITIAALMPEVVGGLTAYRLDKFEQERHEIYIYDLAVDARCRRRGIATALIAALQAEAARQAAYVIFVQADVEDAAAIALYEKHGVKETVHHFDIPPLRRRPT